MPIARSAVRGVPPAKCLCFSLLNSSYSSESLCAPSLIAVPPRSPRPAALEGNPLSKDCKSDGAKYINNDQKL